MKLNLQYPWAHIISSCHGVDALDELAWSSGIQLISKLYAFGHLRGKADVRLYIRRAVPLHIFVAADTCSEAKVTLGHSLNKDARNFLRRPRAV